MKLIIRNGRVQGYGKQLIEVGNTKTIETTEDDLVSLLPGDTVDDTYAVRLIPDDPASVS